MSGLDKACTSSISFKVHDEDIYLRHQSHYIITSKYIENEEQLYKDASFIQANSLSLSEFQGH